MYLFHDIKSLRQRVCTQNFKHKSGLVAKQTRFLKKFEPYGN